MRICPYLLINNMDHRKTDLQMGNGLLAGSFSVNICTLGELNYVWTSAFDPSLLSKILVGRKLMYSMHIA